MLTISNEFYASPIMDAVRNAGSTTSGASLMREAIFIHMLVMSSSGQSFNSHRHLAGITLTPVKQCELVWNLCIDKGVLKKKGEGYSAERWIGICGLFNTAVNRDKTRPERTETEELSSGQGDDENAHKTKNNAPIAQIPDEVKEQVRPNVRLTRSEIELLKKDYNDEQITKMLDKLSEYKLNTGKVYSSDYQAIRRWVYKAVETTDSKATQTEFPDWVFKGEMQ